MALTQREWLILGAAGAVGFYFYKQSQKIPVAAGALKTALTQPVALNPGNIAAIGADAKTIVDAIKGLFSTPATPVTTGGTVVWDSSGVVTVNDLVNAPAINWDATNNPYAGGLNGWNFGGREAVPLVDISPTMQEYGGLRGWAHGRKVVEPLRPQNVPDVGMMPDYRMGVVDPAQEDLYGRPDPANLMYPRY